eukprot:m.257967 g.257967  ORF g.257967 m.257967 type:complete len:1108 (-) comp21211_c0_seq1:195-3518(-)
MDGIERAGDRPMSSHGQSSSAPAALPEMDTITTTMRPVRRQPSARSIHGAAGKGDDESALRNDGTEVGMGGMTHADLLKHILDEENQIAFGLTPLHIAAGVSDDLALTNVLRHAAASGLFVDYPDAVGRTALFFAVLSDSKVCAEILLQAGADVNHADADGRTVMHWACYHGRDRLVKLFCQHKVDVGLPDKEGRTCLHWATACKSVKPLEVAVKEAAAQGQSIDPADQEDMTPLHWAAFHNRPKHAQTLIKAGANPRAPDMQGKYPIQWTAGNSTNETVKVLLPVSKDVINKADDEHRTLLHACVAESNAHVLTAVMKSSGVNPNVRDETDRTALHWAAAIGSADLVQALIKNGADDSLLDRNGASPLHYAAQHARLDCIAALLAGKQRSDVPDNDGRYALTWAVMKESVEACEALLKGGVSPDKQDNLKRTALHVAAYIGSDKCVAVLLKYKASRTLVDASKQTALFPACEQGHLIAAKTMIDGGLSVNPQPDIENRTPMHWASINGRTDIITLLAKHKAAIDVSDQRGETPLHYACFFGQEDCAVALLRAGADPDIQDNEGISPLHWAALQGHRGIVEALLQASAYPNFMEINGNKSTPLDYAYVGGNEACAELLAAAGAYGNETLQVIAAIRIQTFWRGIVAKRQLKMLKTAKAAQTKATQCATQLQAICRGYYARAIAHRRLLMARAERSERDAMRLAREKELEQMKSKEEQEAAMKRFREEEEAETRRKRAEEELESRKKKAELERQAAEAEAARQREVTTKLLEEKKAREVARELARAQREEEERMRKDQERERLEEKRKRMEDEQRRRKEEESHKAEQNMHVLMQQQMRGFMVRAEQKRLVEVRAAVTAARVIQRAWRAFCVRRRLRARALKRASRELAPLNSRATTAKTPVPRTPVAPYVAVDTLSEHRRLVAALTIQLWWRRILRQRAGRTRALGHGRRSSGARTAPPERLTSLQNIRTRAIYGSAPPRRPSDKYVPTPPRNLRSHHDYSGPSGALLSLASAVGAYLETPSSAATRQAQARGRTSAQLRDTQTMPSPKTLSARNSSPRVHDYPTPHVAMRRTSSLPMLPPGQRAPPGQTGSRTSIGGLRLPSLVPSA